MNPSELLTPSTGYICRTFFCTSGPKESSARQFFLLLMDIDEALLLSDRVAIMTTSLGRIKEIIKVPFPRPRLRKDLSIDPNYLTLKSHLLSILYGETVEDTKNQENEFKRVV